MNRPSHFRLFMACGMPLVLAALAPETAEGRPPGIRSISPLSAAAAPCVAGPTTLCLNNQRFKVDVRWEDFQGNTGAGTAAGLTSDTGYFWFFSSTNVELVVKVVDGRALNGNFWVFYGALSNVAYTMTVADTLTGSVKTYSNPSGRFASVGDTQAFSASTVTAANSRAGQPNEMPGLGDSFQISSSLPETTQAPAPCPTDPTSLYLSGCRFRVEVKWKDFQGKTGDGTAVGLTGDTGTSGSSAATTSSWSSRSWTPEP